jgi:hypothetical protein
VANPLAAGLAALVVLAAACAPPAGAAAARVPAPVLYVADAGGTVTPRDAATGRAVGPPVPAGPAPWQMAPGPNGSLLVLPAGSRFRDRLTFVPAAGTGGAARPVPIDPDAFGTLLAGDGGPYAAVAYQVLPPARTPQFVRPSPCGLALVDLRTGTVARVHAPCGPNDVPLGLALENGPTGPVAYLGLWRRPGEADGRPVPGGGRVVALHGLTGAALGAAPLAGLPVHLLVAPAAGEAGRRLYAVEAVPDMSQADSRLGSPDQELAAADRWHLWRLHPATLDVETGVLLQHAPRWLAIAPDGAHAYALAGPGSFSTPSPVLHIDLTRGAWRLWARVPGSGLGGLAVTADRVYVPDTEGGALAVVDRRSGLVVRRLPAGRHPLAITLAGA